MSDNKESIEPIPGGESQDEQSFAELYASYDAGMGEDLKVGDRVSGEIISVGMDTVFVNTGTKIDGAVDKAELLDENGELAYAVGDPLDLYVVAINENELKLSRALSGAGGLELLRDAYAARVPVEGTVKEQCKGGFRVAVMHRLAFCPVSQIDTRYVEQPEEYIGQSLTFLITQFEENGRNIVLSRRKLLEAEQKKGRETFLESLEPDQLYEGRVTNLMPYGAFVELYPGLEGMVHVSEIGWSRVEKPADVLQKDDTIQVRVLSVEPGKKPDQPKIALSIKQAQTDPWEKEENRFKAGDRVKGKVTRCADFGAFVEIAPGMEGLVHISEMSYVKRVLRPEDVCQIGDAVDVLVKEVDLERRRISLSMKDAEGDPWIGVRERYPVGTSVEGTVENLESFGLFVTLEPGITGLMPKSKLSKAARPSAIEKLKPGEPVQVTVTEINPGDRKITLAPGDMQDEGNWKQYARSSGNQSLGSLGEKLQQALNRKK